MKIMGQPVKYLHRAITRPFVLLIVLLSSCTSTSPPAAGSAQTQAVVAEIVEVVDGDTLVVSFAIGEHQRSDEIVRLLGIDTPETVDPTRPVQCFGPEASAELERLLPAGSAVWLERDVEARDRFGRLLAYVYRGSDDLFINEALVSGGFADVSIFEPNNAYRATLTAAAIGAKTTATGLWGACGGPDVPLDPVAGSG